MNTEKNISFVIPAYNCSDTLTESIDSIFNTNFEASDEVIIVNDGSSDNTENEILKLQEKYSIIKYIKNEVNKGCPASRNIGIRASKNPLIFNLDSDNILVPGSIKELKKYLIEQNADVASFSEDRYFERNIKKVTHKWVYDRPIMTLADFLAGPFNPGPGGNFLYTKASWERIGGYWEYGRGLHEAWGFTLKQLANGSKFVVLPNSYYFHRYGHPSLATTESGKKFESSKMATMMIVNYIDLIHEKDAEYIRSPEGSLLWFENFLEGPDAKPIHLKSGVVGVPGYKVILKRKSIILENLKKIIPSFAYMWVKKAYIRLEKTLGI